jgi:hypothetical protein
MGGPVCEKKESTGNKERPEKNFSGLFNIILHANNRSQVFEAE